MMCNRFSDFNVKSDKGKTPLIDTPVEFVNYADFADQILDVFQSIQGKIEIEVDYKADAFNPITIKEVFDC